LGRRAARSALRRHPHDPRAAIVREAGTPCTPVSSQGQRAFSRRDDVRAPRTVRNAKPDAATTSPPRTSALNATADPMSNDGTTRRARDESTKLRVTVRTTTYWATPPAATPATAAAPSTTTNSATTPIIT